MYIPYFCKNALTKGTGSTYLEFDDVVVPVSNLLGQENNGFKIIMSSKAFARNSRIVTEN